MNATFNDQRDPAFSLRVLPLLVGLALLAMSNRESIARSNETSAAFTATQLVRQFTLKNTVAQVNQGMQGYVAEVNGQLRSEAMGPTPTNYPMGMGSVPSGVNLPQRDGAGRPLGYCAWDNASGTSNASYLAGAGVPNPLVYAVISPGLNGAIETTCSEIRTNGTGNNDDYVLTTAPAQASSRQFRSAVGTEAELFAMSGENGDVRLVTQTNRLYSHLDGAWSAIGSASTFADDSATNGAGAISYTAGKVTVGDFQAGGVVVTGALSAASIAGTGANLTDLNMSNAGSGLLSAAFGGTGVNSSAAANGQLLIGNGSGFALGGLSAGSGVGVVVGAGTITISNTGVTRLAGTLDQVMVSGATGEITLSLPQAIGITSSPTFGGLSLNGALAGTDANFTGVVNMGSLSVAGVPATLAFTHANSTGNPAYRDNLALGGGALSGEKRGGNVAIGPLSLASLVASGNTMHGTRNTALGSEAMFANQTGRDNVAVGQATLYSNTTGSSNVALGQAALAGVVTGQYSTGVGRGADVNTGALNYATTIGASSRVGTSNTIVLGALGNAKDASVSSIDDQVVIGATARNDSQLNTKLFVNGAVNIADKLFVNGVEITGSGSTNASDINSGLLASNYGGTGVNGSAAANGQLLIGNGSGYTLSTIAGTANQVNVTNGAGSITLSLPQNIATTSAPVFGGLTLNGGVTGTMANFSGRVDVGSLYVAGEPLQAMTKTNIDVALTFANDTGDVSFTQPNLALGAGALSNAKRAGNVAIGANVLGSLSADPNGISGSDNTGVGYRALPSATTGYRNTAIGSRAAHNLTTGYANTAIGRGAGFSISSGYENTVLGENALFNGTSSYQNVAVGKGAMFGAGTAYDNTAVGNNAMLNVTAGYANVAVGRSSLQNNNTGFRNTGVGAEALRTNVNGSYNLGLGYRADVGSADLVYAQAIGNMSRVSTSNTLVLGGLGVNKFGSATDDQIVIGGSGRNDSVANTKLYVNGATHLNGNLVVTGSIDMIPGQEIRQAGVAGAPGTPNSFLRSTVPDANSWIFRHESPGRWGLFHYNTDDGSAAQNSLILTNHGHAGWTNSTYPSLPADVRASIILSQETGAGIFAGTVSAVSFNTTSDRRMKVDIQEQDIEASLAKLERIRTHAYNYAASPGAGRRIGVIAQEILPMLPEAVTLNADGYYSVDYGALGAMAAAGVGQLNTKFKALDKKVDDQGVLITTLDKKLAEVDGRVAGLEDWKTGAVNRMDTMQNAIDLNIQKIADNALAIQANTADIERLDDALFTLDGRVKNSSDLIAGINARWARNFNASEDGSVLAVNAIELKVSNFTAQNIRANTVYSMRLEAEMARIAELEVNSLRANSAVANVVKAEQVNTGSAQVYAGAGLPAVLFSAKSDGHYTVNTSALDGSYATATVIVNAGQAKVITTASEGIELFADGNSVKAIAAGKSIKASWIKTG
jgi:trimeric autotransporter adhesin